MVLSRVWFGTILKNSQELLRALKSYLEELFRITLQKNSQELSRTIWNDSLK